MRLERRRVLQGAAAALATPALIPHALGASPSVLRFVPNADLGVMDPFWTSATVTGTHTLLVYDTLFAPDSQGRPRPQMAAGAVTDADKRRWTVTLREGLHFHDGTPVLARDCAASLKRWGRRDSFGQTMMAATDDIVATGDRTLEIRLKRPFPLLLSALGKPISSLPVVMPERLAQVDAYTQVKEVIRSGPFRYVPGERIPGARVHSFTLNDGINHLP